MDWLTVLVAVIVLLVIVAVAYALLSELGGEGEALELALELVD
jgi:hypothetical protein